MENQLIIGGGGSGFGFTSNGNGYSFPAVTLNDATGDEAAFTLEYTTNKATSGADTGIELVWTDTLSPGISELIKARTSAGANLLSFRPGINYFYDAAGGNLTGLLIGATSTLRFFSGNGVVQVDNLNKTLTMKQGSGFTVAGSFFTVEGLAATNSSGIYNNTHLKSVIDQTATGGSTDLLINRTEIAAGSGAQLSLDLQVNGVSTCNIDNKGLITVAVTAGITADVGSVQGGSPLVVRVNEVSTCANVGDAVTLKAFPAVGSIEQTIINNGANACDVFPDSGDDIGAGADTAVSLAAGANITYISYDATNAVAKT